MGHVGLSCLLYGCSFYFCLAYAVGGFWPWFRDVPVNQMSHVFALVHWNIGNAVYLQYIQQPENNNGEDGRTS